MKKKSSIIVNRGVINEKEVCILAISAMTICSVPVSANTHTISTTQKVLEHSSENQIVDDGVFEVDKVSEKKIIKFYKKNSKKKKINKNW